MRFSRGVTTAKDGATKMTNKRSAALACPIAEYHQPSETRICQKRKRPGSLKTTRGVAPLVMTRGTKGIVRNAGNSRGYHQPSERESIFLVVAV